MAEGKRTQHLALSVAIAGSVLVLCVFLFWPILKTLIVAATVAVVLIPYYRWVERKLWGESPKHWKQALTAGAIVALSVVIIVLLLGITVLVVVDNFELLKNFAVKVASVVQEWLSDSSGTEVNLQQAVADRAQELLGYVQSIFFAATGFAVRLMIFVASLYFLMRHGGELVENIRQSFSERHREVFNRFANSMYSVLYAIYVVHVATAVITFVLALPFFALIGFKNILFWSLVCAIFQLIPIVGPSLIMFAIAAYAFAIGDSTGGILCLTVGYPVVAVVPDVVFRPIMMGRQAKLSALLLLLGFIGGLVSMGAIGFVLGPLALALLAESLRFASERMKAHYGAEEKAAA